MRCPHHFKNATLEMDGGSFDDFNVEVITCCHEFQKRVEETLNKLGIQQDLLVVHDIKVKLRPLSCTLPARPTPLPFPQTIRDGH